MLRLLTPDSVLHSWQGLGGVNKVPGIGSGSTANKASVLPTALSLWPQVSSFEQRSISLIELLAFEHISSEKISLKVKSNV